MDYKAEFDKIASDLDKKKSEQVTLMERKRMYEEELTKIDVELKALGINSVQEAEVFLLETEKKLTEVIDQCRKILA